MKSETQNSKIESLANIQAVLAYLDESGWQVSQSGLYKHRKAGKITSQPDGTFLLKDVDKYAKSYLKQKATGKKKQDAQDELQRQKLEKELEKLDTDNARSRLKLEVEEGKYIPKDQMFLELASRAGVLEAGLKHWIQSTAANWINLVAGDLKKVGELVAAQGLSIDELINQYATMKEFQVIIEGNEDEESE